ncbi:MAG: hypothetical protein AAF721_22560 [Myxococcota bacterium]
MGRAESVVATVGLAIAMAVLPACDDGGGDKSAAGAAAAKKAPGADAVGKDAPSKAAAATDAPKDPPAKTAPKDVPGKAAPNQAPGTDAPGTDAPSAAEPAPPAEPAPTVSPLERLARSKPEAADPSKTAWGHYKAKRFTEAQPFFAQAALADRVAWKHPFNLACAASQAGDEDVAKHALVEAVSRDATAVPTKARKDDDLAAVRSKAWFEPVLRGEPLEEPKPPEPEPTPTTPTESPTEPAGDDGPEPTEADEPREGPLTKSPGSVKPLAKAQLAELRTALADHHGVRPVIRGSVHHGAGQDVVAWAAYEYSLFDECLKASTKKECRKRLRGDPDDKSSNQMRCTEQWLVRVQFAGTVKLGTPEKILKGACTLGKVRRMEAKDYDADGAVEVMVDVTSHRDTEGFREGEVTEGGRFVRIVRLDGSTQFELAFSWITSDVTPSEDEAHRFSFETLDGDAHPDIMLETVVMDGMSGPRFDNESFPNLDDFEEEATLDRKPQLYDPKADKWVAAKP